MIDEDNKVFTMSNEFLMLYLQSKKKSETKKTEAEETQEETEELLQNFSETAECSTAILQRLTVSMFRIAICGFCRNTA